MLNNSKNPLLSSKYILKATKLLLEKYKRHDNYWFKKKTNYIEYNKNCKKTSINI